MTTDKPGYLHPDGTKRDWYCGDVLSGALAVRTIFEDDRVWAFHHPDPGHPIHAVVVPKAHVASVLAPEARDGALLTSMVTAVQRVASELGLATTGFALRAFAAGPGVTPHMHWHVVGPGVDPPSVKR